MSSSVYSKNISVKKILVTSICQLTTYFRVQRKKHQLVILHVGQRLCLPLDREWCSPSPVSYGVNN